MGGACLDLCADHAPADPIVNLVRSGPARVRPSNARARASEALFAKYMPKTEAAEKASAAVNFTTGQAMGDESFASERQADGLTFIERQAIDFFGTKRTYEALRGGLSGAQLWGSAGSAAEFGQERRELV